MGTDLINALITNADKLEKCIDKSEKQEQKRKDKQLYDTIEEKVRKEEHKREKPRGQDRTLKKCKRLFKEGASPEVLTKLKGSFREQEKYYRYYVQCFLPALNEKIKQSKKLDPTQKKEIISQITIESSNKGLSTQSRRGSIESEAESGYGSDAGDEKDSIFSESISHTANEDQKAKISEERITGEEQPIFKAIKNGNQRKFEKYLKRCTDISSVKDEEGNNILHLIASLEKKQKCKFLGTLITKKDLAQLADSENRHGKTPFQVALINKITKGKHESHTIQSNDNTLKFLTKSLEHGANPDQLSLPAKDLEKLSKGQRTYYCNFLEKLTEQGKKSKLTPEIRINTEAKNREIIEHTINIPDSNSNYLLHLAIKKKDKKLFKELLQKGADISLKDANGNNALHHIASLKKEHKIKYLELILDLKNEGIVPSEKLHEAINAKNDNDRYPAQVALIRQKEKIPSEVTNCFRRIRPRTMKHYYTAEFCAMLLQNGAENKNDHITLEEYDNEKHYHTLKRIKDLTDVNPETLEKLKDHFSKKNDHKNKAPPVKRMVAFVLCSLICAAVCFAVGTAGGIAAGVLFIIVAAIAFGAWSYLKYVDLQSEKPHNAENQVAQELQYSPQNSKMNAQEPQNQSEYTENPATEMSGVSTPRQLMNKLVGIATTI